MGQIVYRANLSAKAFPLLTDFQGRTVIVPGPDNTFNRSLVSSEDVDRDVGVPILYYAHNVLPAPYGFNSVGYEQTVDGVSDNSTDFTSIRIIRSNPLSAEEPGPNVYFSSKPGTQYILNIGVAYWVAALAPVSYPLGAYNSFATVQGITYIFYKGIGCYKYNSVSNTLIPVALTGLVIADIVGIASCQGYLIAHTKNKIFWSSTVDIDYTLNSVDFTPSLITGAGSIIPEGAKGDITVVATAAFGLTVYTSSNIVSGIYSGNSRYPFNFREIVNSGGCTSDDFISYGADSGNQYAYTTSGIQLVNQTQTQTVLPDITDFLAGQDFEDFDEITLKFSRDVLSVPMTKKLISVADRYFVVSYGKTSLTHAIVYDTAQKRYGKLKIEHTACFEFQYLDPTQSDAPRKSIGFLKANGTIVVLNPSVTFSFSTGVILLGKFQYARSRLLTLEGVVLQTIHPNQSANVYNLSSETGGTVESQERTQGYETSTTGQSQRTYDFHETAINHSILIVGGFFLSSLVLNFHIAGRR